MDNSISILFRDLISRSEEPIFYTDSIGKMLYANDKLKSLLCLQDNEVEGKDWFNLIKSNPSKISKYYYDSIKKGVAFKFESHFLINNEDRMLCFHVLPIEFEDNHVTKFVGFVEDFTTILNHEKLLEGEEKKFNALLRYSPYGIIFIDNNGCITSINSSGISMLGYDNDMIAVNKPFSNIVRLDDAYKLANYFESAKKGNSEFFEFELISGCQVQACFIHMKQTQNVKVLAILQDISDKKKNEDIIWRQANFDQLTQLPNRNMFQRLLIEAAAKSDHNDTKFAVMFIDLDRFKEVNDTLGHDFGDLLLQEVAIRIMNCLRSSDSVGRFGGDEFVVIINDLQTGRDISSLAQSILITLAAPYNLNGEDVLISGSIGIVKYPEDTNNYEQLLRYADQAMFDAKRRGRDGYSFFNIEMQIQLQRNRDILNEIKLALKNDEFELYYQPIIDLETNKLIKAEALIRWNHPTKGIISPVDFINVAEETGIIVDVGNWVFYEAIRQYQDWKSKLGHVVPISINKSPVQFINQRLRIEENWIKHLEGLNLPKGSLTIEITENFLLEPADYVSKQLHKLRKNGCAICLDDFGTGYSSLSYLKKFEIDYLKIDKSFVEDINTNESNLALCEAVIAMSSKLGIEVIAEGVETSQQRDLLKGAGCKLVQGFLYSKAIPADEYFASFLKPNNT